MVLGLDPSIISSSEFGLEILILVEIALSLLISDSWSAEFLSTLIHTPVVVVLLGSGDWLSLGLKVNQVWVSVEIAGGFGIGETGIACLDSLLFLSLMRPVLLGFVKGSKREFCDNIWVSVEVALSLLISHVTSGALNTLV